MEVVRGMESGRWITYHTYHRSPVTSFDQKSKREVSNLRPSVWFFADTPTTITTSQFYCFMSTDHKNCAVGARDAPTTGLHHGVIESYLSISSHTSHVL